MANPTMTLIASNTVGSGGVSSVTFSSIPQTYTDLVIKISARGNSTGNYDQLLFTFNGSTTSFTGKYIEGTGSTANSYSGGRYVFVNGNAATTNTFGNAEVYIPNYAGSQNKSYSLDDVGENNATNALSHLTAGLWSNTAAITSITLDTGAYGNGILQYSTFYLYGIKNS